MVPFNAASGYVPKISMLISAAHPPENVGQGRPKSDPPEQLSGKSPSTPLSRNPVLHPPGIIMECRVCYVNLVWL